MTEKQKILPGQAALVDVLLMLDRNPTANIENSYYFELSVRSSRPNQRDPGRAGSSAEQLHCLNSLQPGIAGKNCGKPAEPVRRDQDDFILAKPKRVTAHLV